MNDHTSSTNGDSSIPMMLFFCIAGVSVAGFNHFSTQINHQQQTLTSKQQTITNQQQTIANQHQQIETLKQQLIEAKARFEGYRDGRR